MFMSESDVLIYQFQQGDLNAFQTIYDQTKRVVYNIVYKMTFNEDESRDITQDVYLKVFQHRMQFQPKAAIQTWIYQIAVNHTLNYLRRKKMQRIKQDAVNFFYLQKRSSRNEQDTIDLKEIVYRLLKKMNEKYRLPLILREVEDLPYDDISKVLGIGVGTVKSRINRARKLFQQYYVQEELHAN